MFTAPRITLLDASILLVDDDDITLEILRTCLAELGCHLILAHDGEQALACMASHAIDIIISDLQMPKLDGEALMRELAEHYPETIRILLTSSADLSTIIRAINRGHIWGYMEKPWDMEKLKLSLEQAIFTRQALAERSRLQFTLEHYQRVQKSRFQSFICDSVAMQFVYRAIENAAPSNASVFITGASGCGKELVAHAIHNLSRRRDQRCVIINCAAIPKELMESEIFGHIKGAFTGAVSAREGAAHLAHGGTLFFDELGEMDIGLQAKLLRFFKPGNFKKWAVTNLSRWIFVLFAPPTATL